MQKTVLHCLYTYICL